MGRRSRKRSGADGGAAGTTTGGERSGESQARRAGPLLPRAQLSEAPKAPWSPFPLVELCILIGLILIVAGFFTGSSRGWIVVGCGLVLVALASLELTVREHFSGYRSHTTLLAGAGALAVSVPVYLLAQITKAEVLVVAVVVFGVLWRALRDAFRRRTGGLGFRA